MALDVRGLRCLVVGGGTVACRKATTLLEAGGIVTMVAPSFRERVPGVRTDVRSFREEDLEGAALVVAATDDPVLNCRIAELAKQQGSWVNVADDPTAGNVIFPAVVERGLLSIAVFTDGASPALAQWLRRRLETEFGPEYGETVALLASLREEWEPRAVSAGLTQAQRSAAWHAVAGLPLPQLLREGKASEAAALARETLDSFLTISPR